MAQRMRGIGFGRDRIEFAPFRAEVEFFIIDPRQLRLSARERFQEWSLHRSRPTGQAQQLDPARRLDHAHVEGGVVVDVGSLGHGGGLSCGF